MNDKNGLPLPFVYKARNTKEIITHFVIGTPVANNVNIVMAQPIGKVPPFCLLIFGSDSKFNAENVSNRWKHIAYELKKLNIEVLTISSDSDPKFNSAMRKNSLLGCDSNFEWFSCGKNMNPPFYVQDEVHIGTKLRNFLLKTLKNPMMLPFGNKYYIQLEHLSYLVENYPKDKHRLTNSVLNPIDRQNFQSVQRICDPELILLLKQHVHGSEATVKFLELIKNFIDSFMDMTLTPTERIDKMWYSIFMVRIWRKFIHSNKMLTLKKNFLSSYCYICLEQNAHSLILLILYLKSINKPHLFVPIFFSSQPCESFFRQIRSFTSTYSTVTNCTVKEIIERINKIQLQSDISNDETTNFIYPTRLKSCEKSQASEVSLPTHEEIILTVEKAKKMLLRMQLKLVCSQEKNAT